MTRITLTEEQARAIQQTPGQVEFCDPTGRLLATAFVDDPEAIQQILARNNGNEPTFSKDEVDGIFTELERANAAGQSAEELIELAERLHDEVLARQRSA